MKKYLLIASLILLTTNSFAQKPKWKSYSFFLSPTPEWYIPKQYHSYNKKISIGKEPVRLFLDNKYLRDIKFLNFNPMFFNKEKLHSNLIALPDLKNLNSIPTDKNGVLLIEANLINPRVEINIAKHKPLMDYKGKKYETPHNFSIKFKYTLDFVIKDASSGEVLFSNPVHVSKNHRIFRPTNFKGDVYFETQKEAEQAALKYFDKSQVIFEMYKSIKEELLAPYNLKKKISFIQVSDFRFISHLSKKKKHPLIPKYNEIVKKFRNEATDIRNKKYNKYKYLLKDQDKKTNYLIDPYYQVLSKNFITNIQKIYTQLDVQDKVQKKLAWSILINSAIVAETTGNYAQALAYLDKANAIDYLQENTENYRKKILDKIKKLTIFLDENGAIKDDVHPLYFKYLNSYKL